MNRKNEHLEQLLQQFVDESEAKQMANDIRCADQLFDQHPAPAVSEQTLASVQDCVQHQLQRRRHILSEMKWISSVAAIVIVTLIAGLYVVYSSGPVLVDDQMAIYMPSNYMPSNGGWNALSDPDTSAIDEIENELSSLAETMRKIESRDSGTYEPVNPIRYELMELEEIESLADSTDFWKG